MKEYCNGELQAALISHRPMPEVREWVQKEFTAPMARLFATSDRIFGTALRQPMTHATGLRLRHRNHLGGP